jgi:hypothetical protein
VRRFGPRRLALAAGGLVVVVVIVVIAVVASQGGSSDSNAAVCNKVGQLLDQQLSGITSQVSSNPKKAASLLRQYASSFRQAAQSASSDPTLQRDLTAFAEDASNASADLTGSNVSKLIGTDLPKMEHDESALSKDCG